METPNIQQFKVYIEYEAPKAAETRRFNIPLPATESLFLQVNQKITDILGHGNFRLTWKDSDGDYIITQNEDDLKVAVQANTINGLLILFVKENGPPQYQAPPPVAPRLYQGSLQTNRTGSVPPAAVAYPHGVEKHRNVLCDGCDKAILGTRYKCLVCPDYDLCVQCEGKGLHREHDAVAVRKPGQMDWKKLFAARESAYGRATLPPHDGPTVELDLNLNQPLESLLRDVNSQVQRVLRGFMPQDISVSSSTSSSTSSSSSSSVSSSTQVVPSTAVPQPTTQETFTETVVVETVTVPAVLKENAEDNHHRVECIHEVVTERESARPDEKVAESIYPVIFPHLVTEQAESVSFAEARRSSSPVSLVSSVEDEDWAFVSRDAESAVTMKDAVKETQTETKENPSSQIEAALDAMSEMGFKNEGNLLRALLENFHGDIGKVLDTINQTDVCADP
ncbi:putative Sequestosome-1 [Hypsibius exemplaris]|uniref:Sequestosome-1 n=1 Tax=Hypsibius exemplaris TaxID=2072580 RepID=A0A1W0WE10_HYPEX|nr:putative Sequestosome-1 [Hypsibius exemplaris]